MTKTEFDEFDSAPKTIEGDITFTPKQDHPSLLVSSPLTVANELGFAAILSITYNEDVDSKIFNISIESAGGSVCRLCVDGKAHAPCGRCHKHKLQDVDCPKQNLSKRVINMPELSKQPFANVFKLFCDMANINHIGQFHSP